MAANNQVSLLDTYSMHYVQGVDGMKALQGEQDPYNAAV